MALEQAHTTLESALAQEQELGRQRGADAAVALRLVQEEAAQAEAAHAAAMGAERGGGAALREAERAASAAQLATQRAQHEADAGQVLAEAAAERERHAVELTAAKDGLQERLSELQGRLASETAALKSEVLAQQDDQP